MRNLTFIIALSSLLGISAECATLKTASSGPWSQPSTWENGALPGKGDVVLIRPCHRVVYDVSSDTVLRSVHVGGTLTFSREKDTLLCAGLIRIAPGEE